MFFRRSMLTQFSILSFFLVAVSAFGASHILVNQLTANTYEEVAWQIETDIAQILLKSFEPADLQSPMTGERLATFDKIVNTYFISDLVVMVKLWAKDGSLVYSSDHTDLEDSNNRDDHI